MIAYSVITWRTKAKAWLSVKAVMRTTPAADLKAILDFPSHPYARSNSSGGTQTNAGANSKKPVTPRRKQEIV